MFKNEKWGLPWCPVVKTPSFTAGHRVPSLVGKLRSHGLSGSSKKKNKNRMKKTKRKFYSDEDS